MPSDQATQDPAVWHSLRQIVQAARQFETPPHTAWEDLQDPETARALRLAWNRNAEAAHQVLEAWQEIASATGNQNLIPNRSVPAIIDRCPPEKFPTTQYWLDFQQRSMDQPIVPFHQITDPYQAMGLALFHIGGAVIQYGLIQEFSDADQDEVLLKRYFWAENEARIAHVLTFMASGDLAFETDLGPEIRKNTRTAHFWLTTERQKAAIALGINPPPPITEYSNCDALDLEHFHDHNA